MTRARELTAREKDVKNALLAGHSINSLVRLLGIKKSTLYSIVDKLVSYGEIQELFYKKGGVMRSFNPRSFVDPRESNSVVSKDTTGEIPETIDGSKKSFDPFGNSIPSVNMRGISTSATCPEGYIESHLNGQIYFDVERTGELDAIRDTKGFTCGYLSKEIKSVGKGALQKKGSLRVFNQDITICYRWFESKGTALFVIYPARLYLDPMLFENKAEVKELFMERAEFIRWVMEKNGWRLTNPRLSGQLHFPFNTPGLAQHYDMDYAPDGADLVIDSSMDAPEVEMMNSDDPLFMEKAKIMANLPTEIMQMKASDAIHARTYQELSTENSMLHRQIDEMSAELTRMASLLDQQIGISAKQLRLNQNILKFQANDTELKLNSNQQSLDDFSKNSVHVPRLDDFRPEGYQ